MIPAEMTEQELRLKSAAIDRAMYVDRKIIADANVTIAQAQARMAGYDIEKAELMIAFFSPEPPAPAAKE